VADHVDNLMKFNVVFCLNNELYFTIYLFTTFVWLSSGLHSDRTYHLGLAF
jgi:hypothetical protein